MAALPWEPTPPPPPPAAPPRAPLAAEQFAYGAPPPPARTISPVLVGAGAALGIVALLALLYLYVLPHRGDAAAEPAAGSPKLEQPSAGAKAAAANPLAKHIEVAGVRIQEKAGGAVRIDFVVVNHSAADLPQLKMKVRLASGGREYFVIPVQIPSVGPYESKDMSTSVKTNFKPYELPDWQLVQAKFTIQD